MQGRAIDVAENGDGADAQFAAGEGNRTVFVANSQANKLRNENHLIFSILSHERENLRLGDTEKRAETGDAVWR